MLIIIIIINSNSINCVMIKKHRNETYRFEKRAE